MLRCLHGYGDTVQMIRYAPLIARRAKSLIVEVAPAMVELSAVRKSISMLRLKTTNES